ncbi:G protein complex beta subunit SfaD [Reticulomyxa filosa]|uniref:G protein complex beta subunit SfaD n=1 Tax=Reticulomyxa filosa TaxID=46433 RepID=X6N5D6_RETFI|nr:G protein complex beta subunit SfaD [Reticulomyxa filosa]|eukprot:ETO21153.1 G protein complex beta subunit SfaD [Reticulomyxa filosa]
MLKFLKQVVNLDKELKECEKEIKNLKAKIGEKRQTPKPLKTHLGDKRTKAQTKGLKDKMQLKGHFGKIYGVDWHHDSDHLLSICQDGYLIVICSFFFCYVLILLPTTFFPLRTNWVMAAAFSPNGSLTAVGGLDNICTVYNIAEAYGDHSFVKSDPQFTQAHYELSGHEAYLSCCKFMDENTILTTSGDATAGSWDIAKERRVNTFAEHTQDIMSVCVDPSSQLFITGSIDRAAKVWDIRTAARSVLSFSKFHLNDINWFEPSFQTNKQIKIYTNQYTKITQITIFFFFVACICWLLHSVELFPNKRSFVSGSDDASCRLFDLRAYQQIAMYQCENNYSVSSVDCSVSGYYIYAGYSDGNAVLTWDTIREEKAYSLSHLRQAARLKVSPSGHAVAVGCWDYSVHIWA